MGLSERKRSRIPLVVWVLIPAAVLLFAGANAHLIYVAFSSQPECVDHLKAADPATGRFRAANSDC
ncbi:MAG: hypothetical protein MUO41_14335 [Methyloceanibacter sp.]|nr:hypothetical protein [Methyloceanibacter sp.]